VAELSKNARQCLDINLFEKPIPELVVDQIERSNDRLGGLPMEQLNLLFVRRHIRTISQISVIRVTN
jgi:hypothetical protein